MLQRTRLRRPEELTPKDWTICRTFVARLSGSRNLSPVPTANVFRARWSSGLRRRLGRFIGADPNIDGAHDAEGYNRYSYVHNNPMNQTDPSGFFSLKDAAKVVIVAMVAYFTAGLALYAYAAATGGAFVGGLAGAMSSVGLATTWSGGRAVAAGAGAGFGSSFAASLLNGGSIGDAFKSGAIGAAVGGITGLLMGNLPGAGVLKSLRDVAEGYQASGLPGAFKESIKTQPLTRCSMAYARWRMPELASLGFHGPPWMPASPPFRLPANICWAAASISLKSVKMAHQEISRAIGRVTCKPASSSRTAPAGTRAWE